MARSRFTLEQRHKNGKGTNSEISDPFAGYDLIPFDVCSYLNDTPNAEYNALCGNKESISESIDKGRCD